MLEIVIYSILKLVDYVDCLNLFSDLFYMTTAAVLLGYKQCY